MCIGLLLCEIVARLIFPLPRGYFLFLPNSTERLHVPAGLVSNVPSIAKHVANAQGIRGDPFSPEQQYRIITIGGSTTACRTLDGPQTWPGRLQTILAERKSLPRVWVGNLGKDGLNTRHHLVTLSRALPQLPKIDAVIFMVGVNDLMGRLAQDTQYMPMSLAQIENEPGIFSRTFDATPPEAGLTPWYRQLGLWRIAHRVRSTGRALFFPKPERALANELAAARLHRRQAAVIRSHLPDLDSALGEYEQNLKALIQRGRAQGWRMIFLTQPALWKAAMTPAEENVLMFGIVGASVREATEYYSSQAMAEGMARYNETLVRVCREQGVECFDLAGKLPSNLSVYFDDCHFTVSGADQVAQLVAAYLLEKPPFSRSGVPQPWEGSEERR